MSEPIIHVYVEHDKNMGDHARLEQKPMTVDPTTTLRELIDIAGKRHGGYISMTTPDWVRLQNDRIVLQVEVREEAVI